MTGEVIKTLDGSTIAKTLDMRNTILYVDGILAVDGTEIKVGSVVRGEPVAGYKLVSFDWVDFYGDAEIEGTVEPDGSSAEFTAIIVSYNTEFNTIEPVTVEVVSEPEPEPEPDPDPDPDYTITSDFVDIARVNGIIIAVDGVEKGLGDIIPVGSSLTLTLNTGGFHYVSWGFDPVSGQMRDFELNGDQSVATLSPFPTNMDGEPTISAYGVTPIEEPDDVVLSLLYSYSLDETDLPKLADARNAIFNDGAGGDVDFTKYFMGLYRLPFEIPTDAIENERQITIGFYKSTIVANYFIKDTLVYDMGTITIPMVKDNFLDFKNTVCVLHLPYSDPVNIDNEYLIGASIKIFYEINVVTGDAVINVISGKVGSSIYTRQINLGLEIPFAPKESIESIVLNNQIGLGNNNGVLVPFVEVLRNESILENGFYTVPVVDESILSLQSGYVEIEKINLLTRATDSEIIGLNMLLNDGVYIND